MRVDELMSSPPRTCDTRDSVNAAAQIMWDHDCGCVPILNGAGRVVGIITDRDVAMAAYTQGKPLAQIPVVDAMARQLFCCEAGTSVAEAERVMRQHGVRRLPVIDSAGKLIGVLTLSDIARAARASSAPLPELSAQEIDGVLTAVSDHHARRAAQG